MKFSEYQYSAIPHMPLYDDICYGIASEAGEVIDVIKKGSRPGKEIDLEHLGEEIGDLIWYTTRLAIKYGLDMEEILDKNVIKLNERHKK